MVDIVIKHKCALVKGRMEGVTSWMSWLMTMMTMNISSLSNGNRFPALPNKKCPMKLYVSLKRYKKETVKKHILFSVELGGACVIIIWKAA